MATEFTGEIHPLADELPMRAGGFSEMGELRQ